MTVDVRFFGAPPGGATPPVIFTDTFNRPDSNGLDRTENLWLMALPPIAGTNLSSPTVAQFLTINSNRFKIVGDGAADRIVNATLYPRSLLGSTWFTDGLRKQFSEITIASVVQGTNNDVTLTCLGNTPFSTITGTTGVIWILRFEPVLIWSLFVVSTTGSFQSILINQGFTFAANDKFRLQIDAVNAATISLTALKNATVLFTGTVSQPGAGTGLVSGCPALQIGAVTRFADTQISRYSGGPL